MRLIFSQLLFSKGDYLTNSGLEDLLAFDDIFLDYFNNFLKNPVKTIFFLVCRTLRTKQECAAIFKEESTTQLRNFHSLPYLKELLSTAGTRSQMGGGLD